MLAYQVVEGVSDLVFVWTGVAQRAVTLTKSLAVWTTRIKAESIFPFKKVGEGEVVMLKGSGDVLHRRGCTAFG